MHAFLIVGNNIEAIKIKTEELAKKYNAKILEYPLIKIDDVRNLNNFLRLTVTEPTIILTRNIEEAGTEALNAFLKNLEEPQENLYFVLTTSSIQKVLPTIVSRCQIIQIRNSKPEIRNEDSEKFLEMTTGQRFAFFDRMKERDEAKIFVESLIFFLHHMKNFKNMEILLQTRTCLKSNGNVNLQLTNLVINFVS